MSVEVTRHTRETMSDRMSLGSSTDCSSASVGNSGKSPAASVFNLKELLAQEIATWRSSTSKFTGASGRVLVMLESILHGTTISPGSSTRAATR